MARRYQNVGIPNTMHRFKYDSLVAALSVHKQKWTRINRLIEEGKYERDRFKMSLHQGEAAAKKPARRGKQGSGELQLDKIFNDYRNARLSCNLPIENVSRDMIAQAIERQKPAIL